MFFIYLKRIFCISLCFLLVSNLYCFADDEIEDITTEDTNVLETIVTSGDSSEEPETYSKHIICIERTTGEVLYEKDAYTKTAMASTTKIMTAIIALERCDLNEVVEISSKSANTGGSTLGIISGTQMTMEALLYGLMLRSR